MSKIQYNLEYEKRLVELLGYSLIGPDGSNRWLIEDEDGNQVGYIQYKKLYNANEKKGYQKTFGYQTVINSSNITYEFTRKLTDRNGNALDNYSYSFDIKRDNQETDHIEMNIKKFPSLTIWSKKYGFISFKVDYQGLYLNFKSKTDNFNIEEVLVYKNVDNEYHDNKEYVYQISYCKKDLELSDDNPKGRTIREISGTQYYYDKNHLEISEKTWISGKLRTNRESFVEGTIEEMATKHQMGIDCFSHFRFFINKIIPFNEDVISVMVPNDMIQKRGLSIFFDYYEKENSGSKVFKKSMKN